MAQTFTDFEFILIDDGSTDGTLDIIKNYAVKDDRIVVIEKENTGLTDSLNEGIQRARGKWIARLDADDIAMPARLENQLSFLSDHSHIVLVGGGCIEINSLGKTVKKHSYPIGHDMLVKRLQRIQPIFPHSSSIFQRETVMKIGCYNPRFTRSQDCDLWLRLSEKGQIACLPQPLVKLRKHAGAISHHNSGKTQIVMGTAATVCHFLRLKGAFDPSRIDMDSWKHFINWLTVRLEQEEIFAMYHYRAELSNDWCVIEKAGVNHGLRLAKGLTGARHWPRIIRDRLFGSGLAVKLADEWMHLQSVAGQHSSVSKRCSK